MRRERAVLPTIKQIAEHWRLKRFDDVRRFFNEERHPCLPEIFGEDLGYPDVPLLSVWNMENRCWCCAGVFPLERCHIIPRSMGGADDVDNLLILCEECHHAAPSVTFDCRAMVDWVATSETRLARMQRWLTPVLDKYKSQVGELSSDEASELAADAMERYKKLVYGLSLDHKGRTALSTKAACLSHAIQEAFAARA